MVDTTPPADAEPAPAAVSGVVAFTEHAVLVARAARMDIVICSDTLDRRIYGDEAFVAAVRSFVLAHRRARLRVLVRRPGTTMRGAHRLVELGRALSSRIEFREPLPERTLSQDEYLLADEKALLLRSSPEEIDAKYLPHAPLDARQMLRTFNAIWEESVPAQELRDLRL
ncbi:hypothetical protein D0B54_11485 [Solimonas sp. K1W22B-7]|uniref:DUF7931 domain-containing protein n=1 Tax=Solimonas sp. K1W22B-7 TaxID=2303331 RepID=UPI000E32FF1D|nr:hypothetical protein [Solimonas sp. K1W22B-7]AXQ29272.1 hypothetical protein D0B54_11485 [Solimonas sp. K1W22B-7]